MRIVLITNTPPPYRVPIFSRLACYRGVEFHAVFCSRREPNRAWDLPTMDFAHHFLRERFFTMGNRYIHNNPDVVPLLLKLKPDVVITDGFNPTHLYAFVVARAHGWPHVAMTDGTWQSEQRFSLKHRLVRRMVFSFTRAFIAASEGGQQLFRSYGVPSEACFYSWLCIDNQRFHPGARRTERSHDLMFCGRLEPEKSPLFAMSVASATAKHLRRKIRLLLVGSGSLEADLKAQAARESAWLESTFHGFATQAALPDLYRSARIFMFPTHGDVWGVVANEACAAGLPVIVTPEAGVAGELILNDINGYVRRLDVGTWASDVQRLLSNIELWNSFSQRSLQRVERYEFNSAAQGLLAACEFALGAQSPAKQLTSTFEKLK